MTFLKMIRVVAFRCEHRGHGAGVFFRRLANDLKTPPGNGRASGLRVTLMAAKHILQALFLEHVNGFPQTVKEIGGRRVREESCLVLLQDVLPVPVGPRHPGGFVGAERLLGNRVEAHARGQHQPFLRAGNRDVNAPLVVPKVYRPQRRDGINDQ